MIPFLELRAVNAAQRAGLVTTVRRVLARMAAAHREPALAP